MRLEPRRLQPHRLEPHPLGLQHSEARYRQLRLQPHLQPHRRRQQEPRLHGPSPPPHQRRPHRHRRSLRPGQTRRGPSPCRRPSRQRPCCNPTEGWRRLRRLHTNSSFACCCPGSCPYCSSARLAQCSPARPAHRYIFQHRCRCSAHPAYGSKYPHSSFPTSTPIRYKQPDLRPTKSGRCRCRSFLLCTRPRRRCRNAAPDRRRRSAPPPGRTPEARH
ncbi:hypothetical protein D3C74_274140 [compost metagenome]